MKKITTLTTILLTASLVMSTATEAVQAKVVKLKVWSDTARIKPFEAFNTAHDDIDLEITTVAPTDLTAKLQLVLRSGEDVPDVIFMAKLTQIAQLSSRRANYLMNIKNKVDPAVVAGFLPNALSPCQTADGRLLCLRNDLAHFILWYDKTQMNKLGLLVPTTWEEFEKVGKTAVKNGLIVGSGVQDFPLINFLISGGCKVGFPESNNPETITINLSSKGCRKAAAMVDRMRKSGALSTHGSFEPAFVSVAQKGKLLMFVGPTWYGEHVLRPVYKIPAGLIAAAKPLKWVGQKNPVTWSWGGGVFGGYRKTEHPKEVIHVITWMTTDVELQGNATTMPADAKSSDVWRKRIENDPYYADNKVYDVMRQSTPYTHANFGGYRFDAVAALVKVDGASDTPLQDKLADYEAELKNLARVNNYKVTR